eukprot:GDKJ01015970.1.p1 GENE.GDKJ01015970.1~~GDKJ01015970.1.p1  ORF type:complete len:616 (+),score=67.45 GDKJ01015970.1:278-1849(+)
MNFIEDDTDLQGQSDFNILWGDTMIPLARLKEFQPWQHFNHFPSMFNITRKHNLSITMGKMQKGLAHHFTFAPRSWSLKTDAESFKQYYSTLPDVDEEAKPVFIMKPNAGCQGKGIVLSKNPISSVETPEDYVVQEYIDRPLLIEGRKFDLRVYCLVTSLKYPSIFVYNDGLVRLCAEAYEKPTQANMGNACKHLTNYAVNKKSEAYQKASSEGDFGSKRNFPWLNKWVDELPESSIGHDNRQSMATSIPSSPKENAGEPTRSAKLWSAIDDIIVKTVLSAQPKVRHAYNALFPQSNDGRTCFEVLGFDILIDHKLQPWLMEVNHTPSFVTGSQMDLHIKGSLIKEVMAVINPSSEDRSNAMQLMRHQYLSDNSRSADAADPTAEEWVDTERPATKPSYMLSNKERAKRHEKFEDSAIANFRRVFPLSVMKENDEAEVLKAPKGNYIPTARPSCDINDQIESVLNPKDREMRSEIYTEILEYASKYNAAKSDPSRVKCQVTLESLEPTLNQVSTISELVSVVQ